MGSEIFKARVDQVFPEDPTDGFRLAALNAALGVVYRPSRGVSADGPVVGGYGDGFRCWKKVFGTGGGGVCEVGCMGVIILLIGVVGRELANG